MFSPEIQLTAGRDRSRRTKALTGQRITKRHRPDFIAKSGRCFVYSSWCGGLMNHDASSNTEVVLSAIEETCRIVVDLNRANIKSAARTNIQTGAECSRQTGVGFSEIRAR